jgi:hypothetical protein
MHIMRSFGVAGVVVSGVLAGVGCVHTGAWQELHQVLCLQPCSSVWLQDQHMCL